MNGLDHLLRMDPLPRTGAHVGLVGHAASMTQEGDHAVARLSERPEWSLIRLFSPEHGFDATAAAGARVDHGEHPVWNLPVKSLYGEDRTPRKEWLEDLDLLVVDLKDIGVRCYTYASTLRNVLTACRDAELPVLVLDRTTPLAGIMDGPGLDPGLRSFVGCVDLPLVFGWGQGPLAAWLRQHDPQCRGVDVQVIPSDGDADPCWIAPSPALISEASVLCYPITVWSEAIAGVDVDRGGSRSFQVWAMRDLPVDELASRLDGQEGVSVRAGTAGPDDELLPALLFEVQDRSRFRPVRFAVRMLGELCAVSGADRLFSAEGCRPEFFDQLMGTADVRKGLIDGIPAEEIMRSWRPIPAPAAGG
jgi:uncharacterized protein YbbC (DUF1343 family)